MHDSAVAGEDSLYASASIDKKTNELIIKIVNASGSKKENKLLLKGLTLAGNNAAISYISTIPGAGNTLDDPQHVSPVNETIQVDQNNIDISSPPYSFEVIRLKMK